MMASEIACFHEENDVVNFRMLVSIRAGTIAGASVGVGVAILLLSLEQLRLFSPHANAAIEWLTFRLCPLYRLGFANGIGSMTVVVVLTILGNAILYGLALGILAGLVRLVQRRSAFR